MQRRGPPLQQQPRTVRVNRDKTTPSLLRVFVAQGTHHQDHEFTTTSQPTKDEYQLYAWRDSTASELLLSLSDVAPTLRANPLARYSLRLIYYDPQRAQFTSREMANVAARDLLPGKGGRGGGAMRSLDDVRFVVGDFLDVAYISGPTVGGGGGPPGMGGMNGGPTPAGPGGRDPLPHFGAGPGGPPRGGGFGAPRGGGGGFGGTPNGPSLSIRGAGPSAATQAWGPAPGGGGPRGAPAGPSGWEARRGPPSGPAAAGGPGGRDVGWGSRGGPSGGPHIGGGGREREREDRGPPPPRRRDSRSRSPVRRRERSRSPPPPPRG